MEKIPFLFVKCSTIQKKVYFKNTIKKPGKLGKSWRTATFTYQETEAQIIMWPALDTTVNCERPGKEPSPIKTLTPSCFY